MLTPDRPGACHDAKLTLYQLTVTLILCQLNQGFFPVGLSCVCNVLLFVVYKLSLVDSQSSETLGWSVRPGEVAPGAP